jgi:integrase/recombinase XerD
VTTGGPFEDLRRFQLHQAQTGVRPPSINSAVAALRFFFTVTLDRADLARRLTIVPNRAGYRPY